jgi:hypothetical protein
VRYHNLGTAPIFDAHPTTNWVVDDESIATFRAGPNFRADAINSGDTYPGPGSTALSMETINDAGTVSLTITKDELTRIRNGTEVTLETLQTSGNYGAYRADGSLDTAAGEWGGVLAAVRATSGTLILDAADETAERYVAAPDPRDQDSSTPALTIGAAILQAFDVDVDGDVWTYSSHVPGDPSASTPIRVDGDAVMLTTDEATGALVDAYLREHPGTTSYDVPLQPGMKIGIKPAAEHHDFDEPVDGWPGEHVGAGWVRSDGHEMTSLTAGHLYGLRVRVSGRSDMPDQGGFGVRTWVGDERAGVFSFTDLPEEGTWKDGYSEFMAPSEKFSIDGAHAIDDYSLFDYGLAEQADVEWTSRVDDDVRLTDSSTPFSVPVSWTDEQGRGELELRVTQDGKPVDFSNINNREFTTGDSLRTGNSFDSERAQGLLRREMRSEGESTLFVTTARADWSGIDVIAIVPTTIGPENSAWVSLFGREGDLYCTERFPALETPAFSGELVRTIAMPEMATIGRCPNDDIYEVQFTNMPVGTELSVFDSWGGDRKDDFVIWQNTRETTGRLLLDPNATAVDGVKVIERNSYNGLLGKVSRAVIEYPGAPTAGP